jgi:hypothetical protein
VDDAFWLRTSLRLLQNGFKLSPQSNPMNQNSMRILACVALTSMALALCAAEPAPVYTTTEAAAHIGDTATVCGKVAGTHRSGPGNSFINLDGAYPKAPFTAFIPASSSSIGVDLRSLEGKTICVSGKIALYGGKPEIVVTSKDQIREK